MGGRRNSMPKRKTHEDISRILLGKSFGIVDKTIDYPVKFLGGSHRKVFHSIPQAFLLGLVLTGDVKGAISGVLHVATDLLDTTGKKEIKKLIKKGGEINGRKKTEKKGNKKEK
jgi:hypothetical protein